LRNIDAQRHTVFFNAGDPPSGVYGVVSGVVKLSLPSVSRGEKVIALLGPGETFGMSALLANEPHVVTAVAARDCTLLHLPQSSAIRAMRRDPQFAREIAAQVNRRFRDLISDIQMMTRQSAIQRTVGFLLAQIPESSRNQTISMRLPANKGDIASKLDLTGAHFSRILHELDAAGLVKLQGSMVTVDRVAALRNFAARTRTKTRR
jgi:CRP-like cAMP-binding protein